MTEEKYQEVMQALLANTEIDRVAFKHTVVGIVTNEKYEAALKLMEAGQWWTAECHQACEEERIDIDALQRK